MCLGGHEMAGLCQMVLRRVSRGRPFGAAALSALLVAALVPLQGPGMARAMRLGQGGAMADAGAAFDGVGRLECRSAAGRLRIEDATGWVVGAADTVVTAAHTLFPDGVAVDARGCVFRLFHRDGTERAAVRVRYARSPWDEARRRQDSAYDVAVLKLDHAVDVRVVPMSASASVGRGGRVRLVSQPAEAGDGSPRISAGESRPFPFGVVQGGAGAMRVTAPGRLFATSADSAAGSSGGMYFAPGSGTAIGVHVGYACGAGERGGGDDCVNFGVRFDATLLALVAAVATDDRPAERMALAQR